MTEIQITDKVVFRDLLFINSIDNTYYICENIPRIKIFIWLAQFFEYQITMFSVPDNIIQFRYAFMNILLEQHHNIYTLKF